MSISITFDANSRDDLLRKIRNYLSLEDNNDDETSGTIMYDYDLFMSMTFTAKNQKQLVKQIRSYLKTIEKEAAEAAKNNPKIIADFIGDKINDSAVDFPICEVTSAIVFIMLLVVYFVK